MALANTLPAGTNLFWYRIEQVLGKGGFGITYLAKDTNLNRLVAIKEFYPSNQVRRQGNEVFPLEQEDSAFFRWGADRFLKEARLAARYSHENLVRVLAFFQANGTAYYIMDYVDGQDLLQILKRRGTLSEKEALAMAVPILGGLALLHQTGYIHRDIKPSNIYITKPGKPVLLDFGSARQLILEQSKEITELLSVGYSPVEQYDATSSMQGPWGDIYAMGATLIHALSGTKPPPSITRLTLTSSGKADPMEEVYSKLAPTVSPGMIKGLRHSLNINPKDRPKSVEQWLKTLLQNHPEVSMPEVRDVKSILRKDNNKELSSPLIPCQDMENLPTIGLGKEEISVPSPPASSATQPPPPVISATAPPPVVDQKVLWITHTTTSIQDAETISKLFGYLVGSRTHLEGRCLLNDVNLLSHMIEEPLSNQEATARFGLPLKKLPATLLLIEPFSPPITTSSLSRISSVTLRFVLGLHSYEGESQFIGCVPAGDYDGLLFSLPKSLQQGPPRQYFRADVYQLDNFNLSIGLGQRVVTGEVINFSVGGMAFCCNLAVENFTIGFPLVLEFRDPFSGGEHIKIQGEILRVTSLCHGTTCSKGSTRVGVRFHIVNTYQSKKLSAIVQNAQRSIIQIMSTGGGGIKTS